MTTDIQKAIAKMQVIKGHSPVVENIQPFNHYEYDVLSFSKSEMLCEFEVKISRSDFKSNKEASKMSAYSLPVKDGKAVGLSSVEVVPNYFSYACPANLIKLNEIPLFAGLYYFENDILTEIRPPKRLHTHVLLSNRLTKKIMRYYSERKYLGGCRLTYENRLIAERASKHYNAPSIL